MGIEVQNKEKRRKIIVSATIPIAIKDATDKGLIKKGDKVILAGFGVGLSWGACLIII